jgi:hypothetical protein
MAAGSGRKGKPKMDHEDLKEIRLDLADAYGEAEALRRLTDALERKAQYLAEREAERAEREALMDAEMFGGYEDYEPSPYFGDYSEM